MAIAPRCPRKTRRYAQAISQAHPRCVIGRNLSRAPAGSLVSTADHLVDHQAILRRTGANGASAPVRATTLPAFAAIFLAAQLVDALSIRSDCGQDSPTNETRALIRRIGEIDCLGVRLSEWTPCAHMPPTNCEPIAKLCEILIAARKLER